MLLLLREHQIHLVRKRTSITHYRPIERGVGHIEAQINLLVWTEVLGVYRVRVIGVGLGKTKWQDTQVQRKGVGNVLYECTLTN